MCLKEVILVLSLVTIALCAYEDEKKYYRTPPPPRILSHKQAQNHDGGFKFAFSAENGLAQTEIIAPDGSRNGGYTYVDPHGKTISVKYTAGKEGFRILEGDHIPRDPNPVHHPQQQQQHQHQQPLYQPVPHYARETPDDGSYKPEKYETPTPSYSKPSPAGYGGYGKTFYAPTNKQPSPIYQQPKYIQPQAQPQSQYLYQERPSPPQYKQQEYAVPQVKQVYANPSPKYYESQNGPESPENNSVEQSSAEEKKEPEYHDEPGKPYSFGAGYAFHFGS